MRDHMHAYAGMPANALGRSNQQLGELGRSLLAKMSDGSTHGDREYIARSPDPVATVQETERRRIAADLHDGLGQMLTLLSMDLRSAKTAAIASGMVGPALNSALDRAYSCARQAIAELRRSVMDLYPSMLDDLGLVASVSSVLREVRESAPELAVESRIAVNEKDVPKALHIVAFRIIQEAVNNTLKHAQASRLDVDFTSGAGYLSLTIEDDGCGIASALQAKSGHGAGIEGMIRRARASGGVIDICSESGTGTRIAVIWKTTALP